MYISTSYKIRSNNVFQIEFWSKYFWNNQTPTAKKIRSTDDDFQKRLSNRASPIFFWSPTGQQPRKEYEGGIITRESETTRRAHSPIRDSTTICLRDVFGNLMFRLLSTKSVIVSGVRKRFIHVVRRFSCDERARRDRQQRTHSVCSGNRRNENRRPPSPPPRQDGASCVCMIMYTCVYVENRRYDDGRQRADTLYNLRPTTRDAVCGVWKINIVPTTITAATTTTPHKNGDGLKEVLGRDRRFSLVRQWQFAQAVWVCPTRRVSRETRVQVNKLPVAAQRHATPPPQSKHTNSATPSIPTITRFVSAIVYFRIYPTRVFLRGLNVRNKYSGYRSGRAKKWTLSLVFSKRLRLRFLSACILIRTYLGRKHHYRTATGVYFTCWILHDNFTNSEMYRKEPSQDTVIHVNYWTALNSTH